MNLASIRRPARYIGQEWNLQPLPENPSLRVLLAFPDLYEIGMSNMGLPVLQAALAELPEVAVERAFCPWPDLEERLRQRAIPLGSLETGRPMAAFDLVGFTLQHELEATNVLTMLDLGGIPLLAEDRGPQHPLVLGGGPCVSNPEPLSSFFDLFVQGEGEEVIQELARCLLGLRGLPRADRLEGMARIPGVYVPGLYQRDAQGRLQPSGGAPDRIARRRVADLDRAPHPLRPLVPLCRIVHDRIAIEISRGCRHRCRFCQAGATLRPLRHRSPETVERLALESLKATGYDQLSLNALNVVDYPDLEGLVERLMERLDPGRISLSLPSIRPGGLTPRLVKQIRRVRKTGFTLAPEAGGEDLRRRMGKRLPDQELFQSAETLFGAGWRQVKLYFMLGFPGETRQDVDQVAEMCREVFRIGRRTAGRSTRVNVTLSSFVPKPQTPLQWSPQDPPELIREKLHQIKSQVSRHRAISLKPPALEASRLEAILARGDRQTGRVVLEAWKRGARFDEWGEWFNWSIWAEAFASLGLDPATQVVSHPLEEPLPWSHMIPPTEEEILRREYRRALESDDSSGPAVPMAPPADLGRPIERPRPHHSDPPTPSHRIRIRYRRSGVCVWLSHLDVVKTLTLAIRRAELPVAFSRGFSPHIKMTFGPPLPVGVGSESELLELELTEPMEPGDLLRRLAAQLPVELCPTGARKAPAEAGRLGRAIRAAWMELRGSGPDPAHSMEERLARLTEQLDPEAAPAILRSEIGSEGSLRLLLNLRAPKPAKLDRLSEILEVDPDREIWTRTEFCSDLEGRVEIVPPDTDPRE